MKRIAVVVYGIFGTVALLFGSATLFFPSFLNSEATESFHFTHNLREQGAAIVFLGLMAFWCAFNYERSRTVHYFLIVFTFLLAGIHWFDYFGGHLPWMSPIYNSVPFVALVMISVFNRKS